MKIFSWVHRQFHHKDVKNVDNDNIALLGNEAFASACDGWREGLLTIGTLGIDLFQEFKSKDNTFMNNQALFFDDDEDDHDHDEEMECPLVLKASKHGFEYFEKQDLSPCDEVAKPKNLQEDNVKDSTKIIMSTRERTTLADLFRADSENNLLDNNELSDDHDIKCPYHDNDNTGAKSIKSFLISNTRKKLRKDCSAQLIKKPKQLMRKMLKKKIHPDLGIQKDALIVSQGIDVHAS